MEQFDDDPPQGGWEWDLYLILLSIVVGVLGVLPAVPALFSVMMFDAPGSTSNPATIILFIATISFPLVCFGAIATAWELYRENRKWAGRLIFLSPTVNVIAFFAAYDCLEIFYGGKFGS